ncbi:MAG: hypothetical protein KatS3mg019_2095 [Fimbriimonadales bacterium]|nr:MAG: hypothetical protein KatS3mg019_1177 [Fimbriimonadales bacterium]GIV10004.1 MAG: hypothetical protein KatS3mg019_2095 [Fimbriimonadales bacterium]
MGYTYCTTAWVEGLHGEEIGSELTAASGEVAF